MYSHIMVGANDIEESKKFYDSIFGVLGAEPGVLSVNPTGHKRYMYFLDGNVFLISEPIDDQEATLKRVRKKGNTIALEAANRNYGTKIYASNRIKIQGKLVSLYRNFH